MKRKPTQKRAIQKYEKVIETALDLFFKEGFHNVSTPQIAEKSNISVGTIYSYFDDKYDILSASVELLQQRAYTFFKERFKDMESDIQLEDFIEKIFLAFVDYKREILSSLKFETELEIMILEQKNSNCNNYIDIIARKLLKNWEYLHIIDKNFMKKLPTILMIVDTIGKQLAYSNKPESEVKKEIKNITKFLSIFIKDK